MNKKATLLTGILLMTPLFAKAQFQHMSEGEIKTYTILSFALITAIVMLAVAWVILSLIRTMLHLELKRKGIDPATRSFAARWNRLWQKANYRVAIEEEESIMLDHNYDGIRELDNHLPPWWKGLFYGSIVFAFVYLIIYHVTDSAPLSHEEYAIAMEKAEEVRLARLANQPQAQIDEENVEPVTETALLAEGKTIFARNCAQCHKDLGEGGIGPNLTDAYWLHGGSMPDIYRTIKVGVTEKGMVPWEGVLSPTQIQNVASYILTLQGSNPPNAKAPQGELYVPPAPEEEAAPADSSAFEASDTTAQATPASDV